jgi:hypothetical protein
LQVPDGRYEISSLLATATTAAARRTDFQPGQQLGDGMTAGRLGLVGGAMTRGDVV